MPTGMGVIDPKFVKGGRKLKKTKKNCTIPPNLEKMKSKKASKIRRRSYPLCVGKKKKRKMHHNEKYAERCKKKKKPDGKVGNLQSREIK